MIQIRAFFEWQEATPEQAFEFCNSFMNSIQTTHIRKERIAIINKNHLRGITFEELEKEMKKDDTLYIWLSWLWKWYGYLWL